MDRVEWTTEASDTADLLQRYDAWAEAYDVDLLEGEGYGAVIDRVVNLMRRTAGKHVDDPRDHTPFVHPVSALPPPRPQRLDPRPFCFAHPVVSPGHCRIPNNAERRNHNSGALGIPIEYGAWRPSLLPIVHIPILCALSLR